MQGGYSHTESSRYQLHVICLELKTLNLVDIINTQDYGYHAEVY